MSEKMEHAISNAKGKLATIVEMVEEYRKAQREDDDTGADQAQEAIYEHPLSVQVRSGWYSPSDTSGKPEEFEILLTTGGPACRIIGELDEYGQPTSATLQYQDWFTPWVDYHIDNEKEREALLAYCQCFYFGE